MARFFGWGADVFLKIRFETDFLRGFRRIFALFCCVALLPVFEDILQWAHIQQESVCAHIALLHSRLRSEFFVEHFVHRP